MNNDKSREVNFHILLAGLIILMMTGPLLHEYTAWRYPELLELVFGGSFLLFVASLARDMRHYWPALVLAVIALICALVAILLGSVVFRHLMLIVSLLFFSLAAHYVSQQVFLASVVNLNKVIGSICIFLLLVICWAIAYEFIELISPGSFAGLDPGASSRRFDEFIYFSLVTITTLGYGDTTPDNLVAGMVAGLEALVGVFYIAILVASLVGDFMAQRKIEN